MPNLTSLKGVGEGGEVAVSPTKERPSYPWGLKITLEKDVLSKLGLDPNNFKVGDTVTLEGKGEITSLSVSEDEYSDGERKSIGIQITDISINNNADFDAGFEDALKEDSRIYRGLTDEVPEPGGFKKSLWEATR